MTRADDQHITDATQAVAYFVVYFWCILIRMRILRIEVENVCILANSAALQVVAYFVVYCWCILIRMRILRIEVENVCILAYSAALSKGENVYFSLHVGFGGRL